MQEAKFLLGTLLLLLTSLVFAGSSNILNKQGSVNGNISQETPLPGGTWRVTTLFDRKQFNDSSVPVEIIKISSAMNKGNDSGLEELIILNRTSKAIKSIKLSYIVAHQEDLETALTRGSLEIVSKKPIEKQRIPGNQRRIFKVVNGKPGKLLMPLVKDGELSGTFIVVISISEITFEDGTSWSDEGAVSLRKIPIADPAKLFRKTSYRSPPLDACSNTTCYLQVVNGQLTGLEVCEPSSSNGTYCTYFSDYCNLFNCVNGQIPDNDGDGYPATEDCNDNIFAINPSAQEDCHDAIDNDCDGLVDSADTDECGGRCGPIDCTSPQIPGAYPKCWCVDPPQSPIVIDVIGDGFNLTDGASGINFDLNSDGKREKLAWTRSASDDAWLALDRSGNGKIDNGTELFGNFTPQSETAAPNGFLALAEYDKPVNGGNSDIKISIKDTIFFALRLWQDTNHNGISEPGELHTLPELGLKSIDLDYKESKRTDQYGSQFRYRAKVRDIHNAQVGRWAWDVFLVSAS